MTPSPDGISNSHPGTAPNSLGYVGERGGHYKLGKRQGRPDRPLRCAAALSTPAHPPHDLMILGPDGISDIHLGAAPTSLGYRVRG